MSRQPTALEVSSLLFYEFRQSVQFQVFRYSKDHTQGYSLAVAQSALAALQSDVKAGALHLAAVDWADVHQHAERLSLQHTRSGGHRTVDILHVATALHLGATEFLTFDSNQKKLAKAEGLSVPV
ncbi:MAG: PilT protein domain protein [Verrucomicrobiales bacterium]|nr:PilT protein domain protein [Verrucomicrobiales bacterium]